MIPLGAFGIFHQVYLALLLSQIHQLMRICNNWKTLLLNLSTTSPVRGWEEVDGCSIECCSLGAAQEAEKLQDDHVTTPKVFVVGAVKLRIQAAQGRELFLLLESQ